MRAIIGLSSFMDLQSKLGLTSTFTPFVDLFLTGGPNLNAIPRKINVIVKSHENTPARKNLKITQKTNPSPDLPILFLRTLKLRALKSLI